VLAWPGGWGLWKICEQSALAILYVYSQTSTEADDPAMSFYFLACALRLLLLVALTLASCIRTLEYASK
jgi:hypothetical protein